MPHYTNTAQTEVRWLDSVDEEAQYLPQGFAQITDAEADTIRSAIQAAQANAITYSPKPTVEDLQAQLTALQAQIAALANS